MPNKRITMTSKYQNKKEKKNKKNQHANQGEVPCDQ